MGFTAEYTDNDSDRDSLISMVTARRMLGGIGETKMAQLVKDGEVQSVHLGRRHLVVESSCLAFIGRLRNGATAFPSPAPTDMAPVDDMVVEAAQIAATRGQRIDTYADAQLGLPVHVLREDSV